MLRHLKVYFDHHKQGKMELYPLLGKYAPLEMANDVRTNDLMRGPRVKECFGDSLVPYGMWKSFNLERKLIG